MNNIELQQRPINSRTGCFFANSPLVEGCPKGGVFIIIIIIIEKKKKNNKKDKKEAKERRNNEYF